MPSGVVQPPWRGRILHPFGGEDVATGRDDALTLVSAYEPRAQAEAIAEAVASPEVRAVSGCRTRRVSLATDKATLHGGEMNLVEVEIRASGEEGRL